MPLVKENILTKLATSAAVSSTPKEVIPVKSVHTPIAIDIGKSSHVVTALLDNGSEVNLISQRCVKELNLPHLSESVTHLGLSTINGQPMQAYGVHYLDIEVVDSLGQARYFQKRFVASDNEEAVVLGMPFLKSANPNINHSQGTFK